MYHSFNTLAKAKKYLEDNPSDKIVSLNYASNEEIKFVVFVPKMLTQDN